MICLHEGFWRDHLAHFVENLASSLKISVINEIRKMLVYFIVPICVRQALFCPFQLHSTLLTECFGHGFTNFRVVAVVRDCLLLLNLFLSLAKFFLKTTCARSTVDVDSTKWDRVVDQTRRSGLRVVRLENKESLEV